MATQDRATKIFTSYIASKKIIIADGSGAARAGLAKTMVDLGAKASNIILCSSYDIAVDEITKHKPQVVICDFNLGARCGLELLQSQRAQFPETTKQSIFMLVTGNTSQSAAAQAAEEDVDCYVIKPYTIEVLRQSILKAVLAKINPSEYMKLIEKGKDLLADQKFDDAIKCFEEASKLDSKPALACFYIGQTQMLKEILDQAEGNFQRGLEFNKIHYRCLVGLFDLLMKKKRNTEAYELVKKISRYFPANPQRLTQVLRLAITTQSYEDIEKFYQTFTTFDKRDEDLIRYVCASLVVTGKFYLQRSLNSRASELFEKAAITAQGRTKVLREIVSSLLQFGLVKDAQNFMERFPAATHGGEDYLIAKYAVSEQTSNPSRVVEEGRKLLEKGMHDPTVYRILIAASAKAGLKDHSASLSAEASKRWPSQAQAFQKALQEKTSD